jgi:hypothetical protein
MDRKQILAAECKTFTWILMGGSAWNSRSNNLKSNFVTIENVDDIKFKKVYAGLNIFFAISGAYLLFLRSKA